MLRKMLLTLAGLVALVVAAFAVFVASRQGLKFDRPYPDVRASADSAVIARGHYVVRTLANCAQCHGDPAQHAALMEGAEVTLSGGFTWEIPPGRFHARNITPDSATGIGAVPDGAIARALRHGVGQDGRAQRPFMEVQGLSDEDLVAVVSYLRTQPAVKHEVPRHEYSLLGRVVRATVLADPVGPKSEPPRTSPRGATVENGRYLVESVVNCWACHTQRSQETGEMTGPHLGGSTYLAEPTDPGHIWAPPNLTRDPQTGRLAMWTEDEFGARFRAGRLIPGSPMPWQSFARLAEDDIRAIYRYLKTVPPVTRDVGPVVRDAKK
jgi:mono/diheme cytochrome c family protein